MIKTNDYIVLLNSMSREMKSLRIGAILLALAVPLAAAIAAEPSADTPAVTRPILPGIGKADPRVMVDPSEPPWRAVGKLQTTAGALYASCTGTLVKPNLILTAAHCLFNARTGHYFLAPMMHFLLGFDRGSDRGQALGTSFVIAPGFDPLHPRETPGSDWALLTIDKNFGAAAHVALIGEPRPELGTAVMIGGYGQDHPYKLMADRACQITARGLDANGHFLLRHNCTATRGVSGGPVWAKVGAEWRIIGVDIEAQMGTADGIAVSIGEVTPRL